MGTQEILEEIYKLPISQRLTLVELTIKSLKQEESKSQLMRGVDSLYNDYAIDKTLTAFSNLDSDNFYEAR
jgi:hypothetical protein